MATEKKKRSAESKEDLRKGILNIGGGIASIVAGAALFGNILQDNEYSSKMTRTPDYYERTYHTTNPQNIELIKTGENAFDLFLDYGMPLVFIGAGIGAGIYGVKKLGDAKMSKYDDGRIDYNSEEYKKWQPKQ